MILCFITYSNISCFYAIDFFSFLLLDPHFINFSGVKFSVQKKKKNFQQTKKNNRNFLNLNLFFTVFFGSGNLIVNVCVCGDKRLRYVKDTKEDLIVSKGEVWHVDGEIPWKRRFS